MANLLANPKNWTDDNGFSPPQCWDGTKYVIVNNINTLNLNAGVVPASGDTVSGVASYALLSSSSVDVYNGATFIPWSLTTTPTLFATPIPAASTGVSVTISPGAGCFSDTITIAIPVPPAPTYAPTSEVMLSWSDDGGHNFANRQVQDIGEIGQTAQRVIFRRIGSTRRNSGLDRVFELSSEAPVQVCLVGASLNES